MYESLEKTDLTNSDRCEDGGVGGGCDIQAERGCAGRDAGGCRVGDYTVCSQGSVP